MASRDITSEDMAKAASVCELRDRLWSPCRFHCPAHADVRAYLEAAAQGRLRDAADIIRRHLPLAAVCGRVCHHPCEDNCRRGGVDQPVAIREVKRFIVETQGVSGATVRKAGRQDRARVAVVGGGPAGLSAARDLAMAGYRPVVFEREPRAGGVPAVAIPAYRLPDDVVRLDVDWIAAHGVTIETGTPVGRDRTIESLLTEGFEAVLLAAGLSRSRDLPVGLEGHPRRHLALDFLKTIRSGGKPDIGSEVLVVGGGNVAFDCARSARRLGASVKMLCLESAEEMPAYPWEIEESRDEGIGVTHRRGPVEIRGDSDAITAMVTRGVTRVFDENGCFAPEYDDADISEMPCDTVVVAIGQTVDGDLFSGSALRLDDRGRLPCDPNTHATALDKVFACGELVTPPGSVVEACASGRRAAQAIDQYLRGRPITIDDGLAPRIDAIPEETATVVRPVPRRAIPTDPAPDRCTHFRPFEHTLAETDACAEARRCMNCGGGALVLSDKCAACLTCLQVCPFDAPRVTDVARIDPARCQACGTCIAHCPAKAIVSLSREPGDLERRTASALEALDRAQKKVIAYVCGHHAAPSAWRGEPPSPEGVGAIPLDGTARLSAADLLHAFELGAHGVIVASCAPGTERYPGEARRTRRTVDAARARLAEAGLHADALHYIESAAADVHEVLVDALTRLTYQEHS